VVKVNVHRLREKLGAETISSVRGGYQFGLELNHGPTKEGG
jgi:hypothetical protein